MKTFIDKMDRESVAFYWYVCRRYRGKKVYWRFSDKPRKLSTALEFHDKIEWPANPDKNGIYQPPKPEDI